MGQEYLPNEEPNNNKYKQRIQSKIGDIMETKTKNFKEVEEVINKAIKKVNGKKENDLCKYIPMTTGGYMHHFTLKKMKNRHPSELSSLLEKFIINSEKPSPVAPKQRAARGSRKKRDQYTLSRMQLEKVIHFARTTGNKEIMTLLSPKKSIATYKRELISSIKQGRVEQEIWNSYAEAIQNYTGEATEAQTTPALLNR